MEKGFYIAFLILLVSCLVFLWFVLLGYNNGFNINAAVKNNSLSERIPDCNDSNPCTNDRYSPENKTCVNVLMLMCNGNNICEAGEYGNSSDCPNCSDTDKCTRDFYDYFNKKCIHQRLSSCCGNNLCEDNENYLNCKKDCDIPLILGDLTSDEKYKEYYSFEGDFVRVNGTALENNNVTGNLGDYDNFKVHVIVLSQIVEFKEDVSGFETSLKCKNQENEEITAKGNYGWSVLLKDEKPYIVIDDTFLSCGKDDCIGQKVDNMVGVKQGYKGGEAKFNFQFLVNPNYNIDLTCDAVVTSLDPEYELKFNFEISYKK